MRNQALRHNIGTQQSTLLDAAINYLKRGWPVLPLDGKVPQVEWKEFQSACPSPAQVADWFSSHRTPPTGIGVVTGKLSGLVVVDCDSTEDAEFWVSRYCNSPLTVATGGGGVHFYYAACRAAEVRNRARLFGRRIDVRGEGGYVVAPPSVHRSGISYDWLRNEPRISLPEFDIGWLPKIEVVSQGMRGLPATPIRKVVSYINCIQAVAGQGGHNATFRAVCKLRDAGLSAGEALEVLSEWNKTNASPPWSARELEHKIRSAFSTQS